MALKKGFTRYRGVIMNSLTANEFRKLERRLERCVNSQRLGEAQQALKDIKAFADQHQEYQLFDGLCQEYTERWEHMFHTMCHFRASLDSQGAKPVSHSSGESEADDTANGKKEGTITIRCHLRNVLTKAAQESATIASVLQMGLIPVLDHLAKRAHDLNDPELETCLYVLDL